MTLSEAKLIEFPKIQDFRGNLSFIEESHIPFQIKRIFYLYNTSRQIGRGEHAHKDTEQIVIPVSGSFNFVLDDGYQRQSFLMDKPWVGLYIPVMIWGEINNFSENSVCLVLASDIYKEDDYYRNYQEFLEAIKK